MSESDRSIFAQVIKDHRPLRVGQWLAVIYQAVDPKELSIRSRKQLAAFLFLFEIARDYTFKAVYRAFEELAPEHFAQLLA
jgi:hypothetical protein